MLTSHDGPLCNMFTKLLIIISIINDNIHTCSEGMGQYACDLYSPTE